MAWCHSPPAPAASRHIPRYATSSWPTSKLGQALQHLVGCRDRLAVDFVGTLGLDHVDHLFHDVDVRGIDIALIARAGAVAAGCVAARRARCGGFGIEDLAQA